MKLGCVVMAAGSSRRFGSNKLLQPLEGKPLYQWALEAVPKEAFSAVAVVTGYEPVAVLAREKGFSAVWNERPDLGVSRTIRLGLETMLHCDGVLFMTADQPFLSGGTICLLAEAFRAEPDWIHAAASGGRRGNPCLFPRRFFSALLALDGDTGGARVIREHPQCLRLHEVPSRELLDCDTPEALLKNTRKT